MYLTRFPSTLTLLALLAAGVTPSTQATNARVFECVSVFGPDATPTSLAAVFGKANVTTTDVHYAEGSYETATVIFADTDDRIEVFWEDANTRDAPRTVRIRGDQSAWETPEGLKLGLDLRSIEAINGRSFALLGFGWDYSGTVVSWEGGRLERSPGTCRVMARLSPGDTRYDWDEVVGERRFSSQHPTMQLLNPKIYELLLLFY